MNDQPNCDADGSLPVGATITILREPTGAYKVTCMTPFGGVAGSFPNCADAERFVVNAMRPTPIDAENN